MRISGGNIHHREIALHRTEYVVKYKELGGWGPFQLTMMFGWNLITVTAVSFPLCTVRSCRTHYPPTPIYLFSLLIRFYQIKDTLEKSRPHCSGHDMDFHKLVGLRRPISPGHGCKWQSIKKFYDMQEINSPYIYHHKALQ